MRPFYGSSGSWIDEKFTLSLDAGLMKNQTISGSRIDVNNVDTSVFTMKGI